MTNLWFTSDPHWGHDFVARERGFDTSAEHDEWLFEVYNSTFRDGDTIWWLGDLAVRQHERAIMRTLDTKKDAIHHLVLGNHDAAHPMHRHAYRSFDDYALFDSIQPFARRRGPNRSDVLLSHFPYSGDHKAEERYPQWRLPDMGAPLIHGHVHSKDQYTYTPKGTLQIHVGIDAWRRPVNLDEVLSIIKEKSA